MQDNKAPEFLKIEITDSAGNSWGVIHAMPRVFSTGSTGYFGIGKISNTENPLARYQFNLNFTLIGSKKKE